MLISDVRIKKDKNQTSLTESVRAVMQMSGLLLEGAVEVEASLAVGSRDEVDWRVFGSVVDEREEVRTGSWPLEELSG